MKLLLSFLIALVILLFAAGGAFGAPVDTTPLLQIMKEKSAIVNEWESSARLLFILGITGVVFGIVIAGLQACKFPSESSPAPQDHDAPKGPPRGRLWTSAKCSVAVAILGASSSGLTAVIGYSAVSYPAYEKSILQARAKISVLSQNIILLANESDPKNQKELRGAFMTLVNDINEINLRLSGDKSVAFFWKPSGVVYAQSGQSKAPDWVATLPVTSSDLYYRGEAESRSLSEARANSRQDAIDRGTKQLLSQGKSVPVEGARHYIGISTVVADTYFTYDGRTETYRYYTLMRLDKSLARPEVVATLSIPAACSSMKVQQGELVSFRVGEKRVYIYLVGQSQQLKLGTLIAPDKADVVVLTKSGVGSALLELAVAVSSNHKAGTPAPSRIKIDAKLLRQASEHDYVESKVENGKSFVATVDGEDFTIGVETHYVNRYANLSVCPA